MRFSGSDILIQNIRIPNQKKYSSYPSTTKFRLSTRHGNTASRIYCRHHPDTYFKKTHIVVSKWIHCFYFWVDLKKFNDIFLRKYRPINKRWFIIVYNTPVFIILIIFMNFLSNSVYMDIFIKIRLVYFLCPNSLMGMVFCSFNSK